MLYSLRFAHAVEGYAPTVFVPDALEHAAFNLPWEHAEAPARYREEVICKLEFRWRQRLQLSVWLFVFDQRMGGLGGVQESGVRYGR